MFYGLGPVHYHDWAELVVGAVRRTDLDDTVVDWVEEAVVEVWELMAELGGSDLEERTRQMSPKQPKKRILSMDFETATGLLEDRYSSQQPETRENDERDCYLIGTRLQTDLIVGS